MTVVVTTLEPQIQGSKSFRCGTDVEPPKTFGPETFRAASFRTFRFFGATSADLCRRLRNFPNRCFSHLLFLNWLSQVRSFFGVC